MWGAFCIFVIIFICVRLVMFCMTPPTPPPPPFCRHDIDMQTLRCRNCRVYAPFGYDGNGGVNLEPHPYPEGNSEEDFLQDDLY